jgi:hypothetical protein
MSTKRYMVRITLDVDLGDMSIYKDPSDLSEEVDAQVEFFSEQDIVNNVQLYITDGDGVILDSVEEY